MAAPKHNSPIDNLHHAPTPANRAEVDLRQKLAQRDERIAELKQDIAAKNRALSEAQRRTADAQRTQRGCSAAGVPTPAASFAGGIAPATSVRRTLSAAGSRTPALSPRGASPGSQPGATPSAADALDDGPTAAQQGGWSAGDGAGVGAAQAGSVGSGGGSGSGDKPFLARQVGQLRIQLAKRDADVLRLEGGRGGKAAALRCLFACCVTLQQHVDATDEW